MRADGLPTTIDRKTDPVPIGRGKAAAVGSPGLAMWRPISTIERLQLYFPVKLGDRFSRKAFTASR
jgi:hypothetical protein